jgi:hypothetical protein
MEEIGKVLPAIFKRHVERLDPPLIEILAPLWVRVAGRAIATHSRPAAFGAGTLTLVTPCSSWAAQIRQMAGEIRAEINDFLGGAVVKKVRVEHVPDPSSPNVETRSSKIEARDQAKFRISDFDFLSKLDPEMACVVEQSFAKYFSRRGKRMPCASGLQPLVLTRRAESAGTKKAQD